MRSSEVLEPCFRRTVSWCFQIHSKICETWSQPQHEVWVERIFVPAIYIFLVMLAMLVPDFFLLSAHAFIHSRIL